MRRYLTMCVLLFGLSMLTGCWDRTEVNDMAFVTATGFDKVKENSFLVSVQAPLPSAMGGPSGGGGGTSGDKPFYVDSSKGRNVREANDNLQKRMSRELFFAHRRVVIFGEKLASEGIKRSLDLILEHPESRLSTYVIVSKGQALDILTSSPHFEQLPAEALRELTKTGFKIDTRNTLNYLHLPGIDPVIPVVKTVKTQNKGNDEKVELQMDGVAIMKDDFLQFMTNEKEAIGISWLLRRMTDKNITVQIDKDSEINLNIPEYQIRPTYKLKNNLPEYTIELKVKTNLLQNEPNLNLEDNEIYKMATDKTEQLIKEQVESIIEHAKKEGVDPYGLGYLVYRTNNMVWENHLSDKWRDLLPDIKVQVKVEADIARVNNKGIKVREA
jgi:spore germination protein KC